MCAPGENVDVWVEVPATLSHTGAARRALVPIDRCLAPLIEALNAAGFKTANCCCGHGKGPPSIVFHDGTEIRGDQAVDPPRAGL